MEFGKKVMDRERLKHGERVAVISLALRPLKSVWMSIHSWLF